MQASYPPKTDAKRVAEAHRCRDSGVAERVWGASSAYSFVMLRVHCETRGDNVQARLEASPRRFPKKAKKVPYFQGLTCVFGAAMAVNR